MIKSQQNTCHKDDETNIKFLKFPKIPSSFLCGRSSRNCSMDTLCDVRFIYSTVMTSSAISPDSLWGISSSSRLFDVLSSSRWCSQGILVSLHCHLEKLVSAYIFLSKFNKKWLHTSSATFTKSFEDNKW